MATTATRDPAVAPAGAIGCGDLGGDDDEAARPLVENAIALTNLMLGTKGDSQRLRPSWTTALSSDVVVHLARLPLKAASIAEVPPGRRCIFVSPDLLDFAAMFGGDGGRGIAVDPVQTLALVLLHESGHVVYGDATGGFAPQNLTMKDITLPADLASSREVRADLFAGDRINDAFQDKKDSARFAAATDFILFLGGPAFNLLARRILDNMGASSLAPQLVFADESEQHASMELRVLLVSYQAAPVRSAAEVIASFLRGRDRALALRRNPVK